MKRFRFLILFLVVGGLFYVTASNTFGILINITNSLPQTVFLWVKVMHPSYKLNDYVVLNYLKFDKPITKQIKGMAGDSIRLEGDQILINGQAIGPVQTQRTNGAILTPIQEQTIPEGHVFLAASHPRSLDSRYAEVGLIPIQRLKGKAYPLSCRPLSCRPPW